MAFFTRLIFGLFLLIQVYGQGMQHNLPDNLEIVDPQSLGLAGADLDKFLGNVKLLPITGNGLLPKDPHTKTQILTVGFEGDEGLNLDDFELPSVDGLPDAEKNVAQAAFSRFQEFFKNPNKSKTIIDDEDLIEETTRGDVKRILTTTTTTTTTTTEAPVLTTPFSRRPVYRPRTPTYTTTPKPYISRTRKIKRPGTFRRTTTTPAATSSTTVAVTEAYSSSSTESAQNDKDKKQVEFKPEQFQDYASIIKDLQSAGPRGPPPTNSQESVTTSSDFEGAPIGQLGFKVVHEPGHSGPPIFEFGESSISKPDVSSRKKVRPVISSATTERHESDNGNTQLIDFSKPNGGFYNTNNGRFQNQNKDGPPSQQGVNNNLPNRFSAQISANQFSSNAQQQQLSTVNNQQFIVNSNQYNQQPYQSFPQPQKSTDSSSSSTQHLPPKVKPTFEQISAEPVGVHVSSAKVPYTFPEYEPQQQQQQQISNVNLIQQQRFPILQNQILNAQSQLPPPSQQQQQQQQISGQVRFPTTPQILSNIQFQQQFLQQFQRQPPQQLHRQPIFQQQPQSNIPRTPIIFHPQQQGPFQQPPPHHHQLLQHSSSNLQIPFHQQQNRGQILQQFNQQQQLPQQSQSQVQQIALQQQSQRPVHLNNNNNHNIGAPMRIFTQQSPPLIVNQNFLGPSIDEKFLSATETPKHVVRNPINLFASSTNPMAIKPPQIYPLSTLENVIHPNFSPNRFFIPPRNQQPQQQQQQQQQQQRSPQHHNNNNNNNSNQQQQQQQIRQQESSASQLNNAFIQQQQHQRPQQSHRHFAARSSQSAQSVIEKNAEAHQYAKNLAIQPATLIGTFQLDPSSSSRSHKASLG